MRTSNRRIGNKYLKVTIKVLIDTLCETTYVQQRPFCNDYNVVWTYQNEVQKKMKNIDIYIIHGILTVREATFLY